MWITQIGDSDKMYLNVVGWHLVQQCEEGVEGAKKREYETLDWKTGVKYEIHYKDLSGKIIWLDFKDTDYGKQLILTLADGSELFQIGLWTDNRYFTDFAKKLPNINLEEDIEFNPYDFVASDWRKLRWVSIKQDGKKVADAYWDGKKTLNGIPSTTKEERKEFDSDDWKAFFIKVKKFLVKEVEKVKLPEIKEESKLSAEDKAFIEEGKEIFE